MVTFQDGASGFDSIRTFSFTRTYLEVLPSSARKCWRGQDAIPVTDGSAGQRVFSGYPDQYI